ncbi:CesT family type III secretion system chaperone [Salmonella enterica]|uniref:Tir chaperone n=1 Tax=Salmonella enterica subsp. VII serovar 40:z4,z24:[z39] TaxID=1967625 RepID=A0A731XV99_SALEE|nr:CesT family type III secretion system chaperone [Salmonella enterica]EDO5298558.1 CesT family type III secretion system chaperone [Salmonella enterica subsp. houtenae serovar 40:z4,z24:-]EDS6440687.1 CesT family type III secretion system chaperone [Salmonella enterica subsp. VII str. CFSAN000550]EDT6885975.1 CesT family type III secretion system chaperone [Salmonella enterica subsp. enterica]EDU7900730.1 CesT family type III secretion system chaperone [Salmonella enterica subsp. houtenae]QJ
MYSRADRLLRKFSLKLNLDSIAFDENRLCSFLIDNSYHILLSSTNDNYIMIYGFCGRLPDNNNLAYEFLNANLWFAENNGPHLCYDDNSQSVLLALNFSLDESTVDKFEREIEVVIRSMESLSHILQDKGITLDTDYT